jgi:GntR family transcriptional regulator, histidine utilization repressor
MSGEWPPGTRVPVEHELMADYGCSRMTVSKVLSALATRGLINRRRGAGSEVAAPRADRAVLEIRDFAKEAARTGIAYTHEVLRRETITITTKIADRLGLEPRTKLLAVDTLHRVAGLPEAFEQRLINIDVVTKAKTERFRDIPPGTWLLDYVPWTDAEHAIAAVNADAKQAALLNITVGSACLVLERRTWQAGVFITEARITYPGARHRFVGRFSPAGQD